MYRTIVVGTDGSETADLAVDKAAALARTLGARLHVVSAYNERPGATVVANTALGSAHAEHPALTIGEQIEAVELRLRLAGVDVTSTVESGDPADALIAQAVEVDADLIVVGDRGLKGIRGLLGSVPNRVAHKAPIDVLVVATS